MMVEDVILEGGIPHFNVRPNAYRRVKNPNAQRRIPIAGRIIDLGFSDYVNALRSQGETLLFPELYSQASSMPFGKIFYAKVFQPLRRHHFPSGTRRLSETGKDVDIHSIRATFASCLRAEGDQHSLVLYLMGHEQHDETKQRYQEDPPLEALKMLIDRAETLLPTLARHPMQMRPKEFRQQWSVLGRPLKKPTDRVPRRGVTGV